MKYKPSIYNFEYLRSQDEYVIYNTYSKALISLSKSEFEQYSSLDFSDAELEKALFENRIVIENDFDEIGFLRYCHYKTKFSNKALHLIIAPTMDCNFGCPYCYENRRHGRMSQSVQDSIITFISNYLKNGTKLLEITWYGGEPLLCMEIIEPLARQIKRVAKDANCELKTFMVTNGYLLTAAIVELLDELGILKIQITIDGLAENHNKRRHLKNGEATFNKLVKNLELFSDSPIKVDVRMNVDKENAEDFLPLKAMIDALGNPNITIYPSPVENINKDTVNTVSSFMSFDEFESFASDVYKKNGVISAISSVMNDRYCFCHAETENCFVIDEKGNCYKCWDQVGREEYSCFNIAHPNDKNFKNILSFLSWDPFSDEKCGKCIFLPICFGGCKFHRINNLDADCGFTDRSLRDYIETTFFS